MEKETRFFHYKYEGQLNNDLFQSSVQNDSDQDVAIAWGATRDQAELNGRMILEAFEIHKKTGLTPRQLLEYRNEALEAIKFYNKGVDHFFSCIDFGNSALDAEAIGFMNDHLSKFKTIEKATEQPV